MNNSGKILVTGGAGYIGSHTVVELLQNDFEPVIVDDYRNSDKKVLDRIEQITGIKPLNYAIDICDFEKLEEVFKNEKFDGIIHFAAYKAVGESVGYPLKYYRNNLLGLLNVLELAEKYNVLNFVFSSSCTVYGEPELSVKKVTEETKTKSANSPYGATKQMGERIIEDFAKSGAELKMLNLRYFNPVGAHFSGLIGELPIGKPNNLLPFVTQTGAGIHSHLTIFGNDYNTIDGTCVRDYIHVSDVAEAHVKGLQWLLNQNDALVEIVNIGTGKGNSVLEIVNVFEKISGEKLNWKFGPRRSGDVEEIFADASKAERLMGWKANRTIEDAVRDAWNWEQKLRNA